MSILLTRVIEALIYPPAGPLLVGIAGVLIARWHRRAGWALVTFAVTALYLTSLMPVGQALVRTLEDYPALSTEAVAARGPQAIVVLAYERYPGAPEYGGDTSGPGELARMRWAARLHRETGLPIAAIGGDPFGTGTPKARIMRRVLEQDFGIEVGWGDGRSLNTFDNARYAAEMLQADGIGTVAVVTHAWHMPRAVRAFEDHGLTVVPAPTLFMRPDPVYRGLRGLIPNARAMVLTRIALHEWIGRAWYALLH